MADAPERVRINTDAWQDDAPYGSRFTEAYDDTGHYDESMPVYRRVDECVWKPWAHQSDFFQGCRKYIAHTKDQLHNYCPYCGGRIRIQEER